MKKYLFITTVVFAFIGCSSDDESMGTDNSPVAAQITADINLTRASGTNWDANDAIGISTVSTTATTGGTQYLNMKYVTTGDGNFTHSGGEASGIFFQDESETVTFRAYYPFAEKSEERKSAGIISDVTTSDQNVQKNFDFMFATGATASKDNPTVKFNNNGSVDARFKHMMTRLELNITTNTEAGFTAEQVADGTYYLSGIKHSGMFNTENGAASATGDATESWNITDYITYNNNTGTCSLIFYPQEGANLMFSVTIDGQNYTGELSPEFVASTSYSYDISIQKTGLKISDCTIQDWADGGSDCIVAG